MTIGVRNDALAPSQQPAFIRLKRSTARELEPTAIVCVPFVDIQIFVPSLRFNENAGFMGKFVFGYRYYGCFALVTIVLGCELVPSRG